MKANRIVLLRWLVFAVVQGDAIVPQIFYVGADVAFVSMDVMPIGANVFCQLGRPLRFAPVMLDYLRPLLCLHTAGADSRQYHGLMTDLALGESWKIVAFDMPFHGRSLPPPTGPEPVTG